MLPTDSMLYKKLDEIVKLRREGRSYNDIAQQIGITKGTLMYMFRAYKDLLDDVGYKDWGTFFKEATEEQIQQLKKNFETYSEMLAHKHVEDMNKAKEEKQQKKSEPKEEKPLSKEGEQAVKEIIKDLNTPAQFIEDEEKEKPKKQEKMEPEKERRKNLDKWIIYLGLGALIVGGLVFLFFALRDKKDKEPAEVKEYSAPMTSSDRYTMMGLPPEF